MREVPKHIITKNFLPVGREYFDRVVQPALVATQTATIPTTRTYVIAGKKVRIHFYGETVAHTYSLALAHHPLSEDAAADFTIYAWDGTSSSHYMIPPWDEPSFEKKSALDDSFFGVYVAGEESLNFYDATTKTGYFWTNDASILPDWVTGAPFRTILHWFLNESDIHLMHGAVVGMSGKSVLLTARSGSGKSTTALSSLISGMDYLADDYVAVGSSDPVMAYSLYQSGKVTREGLELFPELKDRIWNKGFGEQEKAVIFLSDIFPGQVTHTATLEAILIPRITGGPTRLVPVSKIQALVAIAPTTLLQLPLAETNKMAAFKSIIERVPCYFLELGPEIREVPETIKAFLSRANTPQP